MKKDEKAMYIYTNDQLLEYLKELAKKLGRTPTRQEFTRPSAWVYYQRFGSYDNAVRKAGLKPNRLTRREIFGLRKIESRGGIMT